MKLVAVFAENRPGQTARVTSILAAAGVNICWVTIANNGTFGVMKFLVDKLDLAVLSLKEQGLIVSTVETIAVEVPNHPGSLHDVAELLGKNSINLDNSSGFVANHRAILVIETVDLAKAREVLKSKGFHLLSQEEMFVL